MRNTVGGIGWRGQEKGKEKAGKLGKKEGRNLRKGAKEQYKQLEGSPENATVAPP